MLPIHAHADKGLFHSEDHPRHKVGQNCPEIREYLSKSVLIDGNIIKREG